MFARMFARSKAAKCNVQLKQCVSRIQLLQYQREMRVVQMTREIAELLRAGKEARAIVQVEQKLQEEATMAAYGVIAASCRTLCAHMPMIEGSKKCPHDLKREIATIIFAAPRCGDLPELQQLHAMFTAKFGKEFAASASELRPDCGVDKRVIDALTVRAPSGEASLQVLAAIAAEHHVDWTPATRQQDGAEAPPNGRGVLAEEGSEMQSKEHALEEPIRAVVDGIYVDQESVSSSYSVVLYDTRASPKPGFNTPLTLDSFLEAGLSLVLYYPFDDDALALHKSIQSSISNLQIDPSHLEVEHAMSASSVIYLHIFRQLTSYDIKRLLAAIEEASGTDHRVTISREHEVYTVERQGDSWSMSLTTNSPIIDFVFYYASIELRTQENMPGMLIAHGFNLLCHHELKLKWRPKESSASLHDAVLLHLDTIEEYGLLHLIQDPESVALRLPDLSAEVIYLECWIGVRSIGRRVKINLSALRAPIGGPPIIDPKKWKYDVFISHTGSEKDLANTLDRAVRGVGLRCFFDVNSLKGTMANDAIMDAAAMSAPVGVLLLSPAFFDRTWPLRELVNIVTAETHLPVWIGSNFDELKAYLEKRPLKVQLADAEWDCLVTRLKNTTTIVQGSQFTIDLMDEIVHAVIRRCYNVAMKLGNQERYNSRQLQKFMDRVLKAMDAVVELKLGTLPGEDIGQTVRWREALRALDNDHY